MGGSIDLLSADLYGEEAARSYRVLRRESPVHRDETNDLWGIATYDGVGDLLRWSDDLIGALSGAPDRIEAAAEAFAYPVTFTPTAPTRSA